MLAAACGITVEAVVVDTVGDRRTDAPIWAIGGQGVFVKEVQAAVLDGRADIAVHSAKDLPSKATEGLVIAAIPPRGDPRDALVGGTLASLPAGARIGTGSVRRRVQLAWLRPDLTFAGLRGNMETRLAKASGFDAIVVAAAALQRLGRSAERSEVLDPMLVVPQVGQGPWRWSAGPTTTTPVPCWPPSTTRRRAGRWRRNGPSSGRSAARATCP